MLLWPIRLAFRLATLVVLAVVVYLVTSGVQVDLASRLPSAPRAIGSGDAIVVLGTTAIGAAPSPDLLGRLQEALVCYQQHAASRILVTGEAATDGATDVANVGLAWLHANGVPVAALTAITATNAASGISGAATTLGSGQHVIIVTDALNALWAGSVARKYGMSATIVPAVGSERPFYREIGPIWTQASAIAVGRIIGFDRTTWASD